MHEPIFFLAILDADDVVRLRWPKPGEAHKDLCTEFAAKLFPGRFQRRKRERAAELLRVHILEKQEETRALVLTTSDRAPNLAR